MLFALVCAALVLIVLVAVCLPLLSHVRALPARGQYDRTVYRDQLREVDRDLARGILSQDEAASARLEIQRRLLAVEPTADPRGEVQGRSPLLAGAATLFVFLCAGGLYWRLGAPGLSDAPFSARPPMQAQASAANASAAQPRTDMRQAAEKLEEKLRTDPTNPTGWILYARTCSILGDWTKAAKAYQQAIELGQKGADVYSAYGEMLVMSADGIVAPAAHDAFATALAADPGSGVARYYLALADAQAGEERKAIGAWLELAAGLPEDSPMREEIGRRVANAAKSAGIDAPALPKGLAATEHPPEPTPEQMQAAAEMPREQRAQMIAGMIEKLAAKMRITPNDLEGWLQLGRAYLVQGDTAKAVDAYDHAAALKPGDPGIKLQTVAALLSGLRPEDTLPPRAIAMLNEVASVAPDAPEVLWYQGVVAVREGRAAEAREKWTKLVESLPDGSEDVKMVRAALDELKGQ
jgi:cytochrome c-type biogenesis protein CcmH